MHNNTRNVNYIVASNQFLASDEEIKKARLLQLNEELKFNKLGYLKELEKEYPHKFMGLYYGTIRLIEEFKHLFAKRLFDRKTLKNIKPARLGIKQEHRDKTVFIPQYNLPSLQRLHMIQYTEHNDKNGFWRPIVDSQNNIPYTMVAKKNKDGTISRWRPAFDARGVNKWCTLTPSWMPTIRDFDQFFALKGLITIADCKNFFDCIPLHEADQAWAKVLTPLGFRCMSHLTYGWKNAAPIAQNIMNKLSLIVGWMLAYIDDMALKHPWHYKTADLLKHLRRFFIAVEKLGLLLHPSKFWPFATSVEQLGICRTLHDSQLTATYKTKALTIPKPETAKDLRSAIGVLSYIGRYINKYAFYSYWLLRLIKNVTKNSRVVWTEQATFAWNELMHNIKHAKILRNPTRNGIFCVKTDASKYGIGGVLYQHQLDPDTNQMKWFIIDMHSAVIKEDLRKSHSMVHEALAVVKSCEHWQFHLMKRRFKVSCDNNPIVCIFDENKLFDPTTRAQLGRLRTQLNGFSFDIAHVPGIDNELPDGLSRFTAEFKELAPMPIAQPIHSTDTGTKLLTEEELTKLSSKRQALMMNIQSHTTNHTSLILDNLDLSKQEKIAILRKSNDHSYNKICGDFKAKVNYAQRKRVRRFINEQGRDRIASDEYQFNTLPCINQLNQMKPVIMNLNDMSEESLQCINKMTEQTMPETEEKDNHMTECDMQQSIDTPETQTHASQTHASDSTQFEIKDERLWDMITNEINIADIPFNCNVNESLDDEYKPKYHKPKQSKRSHVQTRSKTKHHKARTTPKAKRVDFIDPLGDQVTQRMKTRDDFIHELVGYRNQIDFFDSHTFKTFQETDVMLQTIRFLLTNKITSADFLDPNIRLDMEFMEEYHGRLYKAWQNKDAELRINDKTQILQKRISLPKAKHPEWVDIVPEALVGRIMDYGHYNLSINHLGQSATLDSVASNYWWASMDSDITRFVKECKLCQYVKHGKTLKAPMRIRELPNPRDHIMADFLDCVMAKYHILVIVDYGSNYAMLIPCERCDTRAVVEALVTQWIPIFGLFNTFETDFGSGFNNKVIKMLMKLTGTTHHFAEARNHKGIGKVERLVGFIQSTLNLYNVQSGYQLITQGNDRISKREVWARVKALLPFIQQSINRRRPRFTQYSPNMMMFGSNLNDYGNINKMIQAFETHDDTPKMKQTDVKYVRNLLENLKAIHMAYKTDWQKYTRLSANEYNKRNNIQEEKDKAKILKTFQKNDKILYYVGDRQTVSKKWRQRWSGPWRIKSIDSETVAIEIIDDETQNSKYVSVDRIKLFNNGSDTIDWENFLYFEKYQDYKSQEYRDRQKL